LGVGIRRAYGHPERYNGKISGAVLGLLAVALFGLFCWGNFVFARRVPTAGGAPQAGRTAPDFTLPDDTGKPVTLSELRRANRAVLLIFYRGYW
jgi:cytochrome oxidase Cu insertion factor (SCO1/SenC/PrrC family)